MSESIGVGPAAASAIVSSPFRTRVRTHARYWSFERIVVVVPFAGD